MRINKFLQVVVGVGVVVVVAAVVVSQSFSSFPCFVWMAEEERTVAEALTFFLLELRVLRERKNFFLEKKA